MSTNVDLKTEKRIVELEEKVEQIIKKMRWRDMEVWTELNKRMTWKGFVGSVAIGTVIGLMIGIILFVI